jgi:putative FmdB family regulatory protein
MPFYEYQCRACGHQLEALQKISDPPLKKCPECGKAQLRKLVSAPVFRLKGGGWYETDFKGDKDNKRNLVEAEKAEPRAEAKPDAKVDAGPEPKSEAKPEAKPQAKTESRPAARPVKKAAAKPARRKARR